MRRNLLDETLKECKENFGGVINRIILYSLI